ncbi:glycosyltransferase family 2 protein [Mycolicibacterium sphagni]|uniref:Glycosyl transferase n=1 Tax=Mycolicibacterium sphagni TaxID=1786 RepID=A0A255DLI1_9MYCO|nr:glycosyltransferase family 2 protein [Mycolicibacterium sphagni]OYN79950.1 glycosyl transferase [Mycolicibacterium sphagni]
MSNVVGIWDVMSHPVRRPKISVVIPALNEERNLAYLASRLPHDIDEVVFVDGGSLDNTAAVARELWPSGVHLEQTRKGKGNALACGFAAASGDIIVMIDADGSTDPAEIPRFVGALISGKDFAKGSRFVQGGGSSDITRLRRIGNWGLNALVNTLFATKYTDLCYGYNAFWSDCLEVMDLPDLEIERPQWGDGFEIESLINVRVAASGMQIAEVSSFELDRIHGASNLNAVKDGLRILWTILQEFRQARRRGWKRGAHGRSLNVTAGSRYLLDAELQGESLPDVRHA